MPAGKLRSRVAFQRRATSDDGYGGRAVGDWATVFTDAAELIPRMGSETVIASRLQGIQPYTVRVRSSTQTRAVDASWRALDTRSGVVYSIVSPAVDLNQKNQMLDLLAVVGANGQ